MLAPNMATAFSLHHTWLHASKAKPSSISYVCPRLNIHEKVIYTELAAIHRSTHWQTMLAMNSYYFASLVACKWMSCSSWTILPPSLYRTNMSTATTFSLSMWIHLRDTPILMNKFERVPLRDSTHYVIHIRQTIAKLTWKTIADWIAILLLLCKHWLVWSLLLQRVIFYFAPSFTTASDYALCAILWCC